MSKLNVAIFDNNQRCKVGKYEVTSTGSKIDIKQGGKEHFKPYFDSESYLEFPYRALSSPWKISYKRMYFVRKLAKKCVNFGLDPIEVPLPDPQQVIDAANSELIKNFGKETKDTPWVLWAILGINLFILLSYMGVF